MRRLAPTLLIVLSGCGGAASTRERPLTLYTHCGVLSARVDGHLWLADPPLSDGSGNPLPGWGFNSSRGAWRELGHGRAEFQSRSGKTARFVLAKPGDRDPANGCE